MILRFFLPAEEEVDKRGSIEKRIRLRLLVVARLIRSELIVIIADGQIGFIRIIFAIRHMILIRDKHSEQRSAPMKDSDRGI